MPIAVLAASLWAGQASASETVTYAYDARGRLVEVARRGAVNQDVGARYSYDTADNRTNVAVSAAWTTPARRAGDFNGDARADILWRYDLGSVTNWLGTTTGGFAGNDANALNALANDWHVVQLGDFNGDNRDDLLLRNDAGVITNWLGQTNGGFVSNSGVAYAVDPNWRVAASGDFNGDGRSDILWRYKDGTITNWLGQSNGGFFENWSIAAYTLSTTWKIAAVGDFNGDGRDDVLLRHDDGTVTEWLGQANGSFFSNHAIVTYGVDTAFHATGAGDFNGDGRDDVLWRKNDGTLTEWLGQADGSFFSNHAVAAYMVDTVWRVASIGDFNGDSRDDILWRRTTGAIDSWLGTSTGAFTFNGVNAYSNVATDQHVEPSQNGGAR